MVLWKVRRKKGRATTTIGLLFFFPASCLCSLYFYRLFPSCKLVFLNSNNRLNMSRNLSLSLWKNQRKKDSKFVLCWGTKRPWQPPWCASPWPSTALEPAIPAATPIGDIMEAPSHHRPPFSSSSLLNLDQYRRNSCNGHDYVLQGCHCLIHHCQHHQGPAPRCRCCPCRPLWCRAHRDCGKCCGNALVACWRFSCWCILSATNIASVSAILTLFKSLIISFTLFLFWCD